MMPCEKSAKAVEVELLYVQYKYESKEFTKDLTASPHPHCGAVASCQLQRKLAFSKVSSSNLFICDTFDVFCNMQQRNCSLFLKCVVTEDV